MLQVAVPYIFRKAGKKVYVVDESLFGIVGILQLQGVGKVKPVPVMQQQVRSALVGSVEGVWNLRV